MGRDSVRVPLAISIALAFTALLATQGAASAQALREVTIGLASASLTGGSARIVKDMGLFEKNGLNAKVPVMDSGSAAVAALVSRSVQFAISGPGDLIAPNTQGQNVVAVANTYSGFGAGVVIAKSVADKLGVKPDAPVKDRLKALDGLIIGTSSATSISTVSLKGAAAAAGANVRFTYMAQPAYLAALESGAIHGHIGGAPFWAKPVIRGSGVLWLNGPKGEFPSDNAPLISAVVMAMRDTAQADPDLIRRIRASFADLGKAVEERPADVKASMARLYPDLDQQTIDILFDTEAGSWKSPPITVEEMAHEIAYVKMSGQVPSGIDSITPQSLLLQ